MKPWEGQEPAEGARALPFRMMAMLIAATTAISALAVLACALIGSADILGTWLLDAPIFGAFELLQMLMVVTIFLGLADAVWRGDQIKVDLIRNLLPSGIRRIGDVLAGTVTMLVLTFIAYAGVYAALRSLEIGEFASGPVRLPIFPARTALVIGAAVAALASLFVLLRLRARTAD